MAELKTKVNTNSVIAFLNAQEPASRRDDCLQLMQLMESCTNAKAKMWGDSIVGFGDYRYTYASGREGDWFQIGFAPRKQNISLYTITNHNTYKHLMEKLGKYKTGKSCIYINKLSDIDVNILRELLTQSIKK